MTVAANIGYGLADARLEEGRDRRARRRDARRCCSSKASARGRSTQLSGGQRQRVALGRALAVDPSLLLLDEPMSNLDYKVRLELRHELRALQQRIGITAVYVTHDREEALTLADRIAVIDAGRDRPVRHARGGLPSAGDGVRRRLHGRGQRARPRRARRRHAGRRAAAATPGARCARTSAATRRGSSPPPRPAPADTLLLPRRRRAGVLRRAGLSLSRPHRRHRRLGARARTRCDEGTSARVAVPRAALMLFPRAASPPTQH